ncbi:MAG: hypothetical protein IJ349_02500 [Clostridia bacterium]|nr:hypothetical protein [Clostridia bacterium]
MKNLLDTAFCMLDDRHIEEAATYTPQTKTISFKKILPIAVCFVLVVVSAFAVKDYFSPVVTTVSPTITTNGNYITTADTNTTVAGVVEGSSTVACAPEITPTTTPTTAPATTSSGTVEISLYCTTPMIDYTGWESMPFQSFYHCIDIGGAYYYADYVNNSSASHTDEPLEKEKLGALLYKFNRSDYRFEINGSGDFTVEIYEIIGYSKEEAVAVGRKDGLMKGYYPYYRIINNQERELLNTLNECQTLSDFIDFANITADYTPENFCTSFWVYYKEEGKEDVTYSIAIDSMEKLAILLLENRDVKAECRTGNTGEKLTFNAYLKGFSCEIYLCNDGYLYLNKDGLTRAFCIGIESYEKFFNSFKLSSVVWTPENPITVG